jgi:hypothetical protein
MMKCFNQSPHSCRSTLSTGSNSTTTVPNSGSKYPRRVFPTSSHRCACRCSARGFDRRPRSTTSFRSHRNRIGISRIDTESESSHLDCTLIFWLLSNYYKALLIIFTTQFRYLKRLELFSYSKIYVIINS